MQSEGVKCGSRNETVCVNPQLYRICCFQLVDIILFLLFQTTMALEDELQKWV